MEVRPRDDDIQHAIERTRAAVAAFANGRTDLWVKVCSHRSDVTLFGGWGGHERGWQQLEPRYQWAAGRFAGAEVSFEDLACSASGDLAYTVWIERLQAQLVGVADPSPVALRVTHVYRREDGTWRLVHRHADPLMAVQGAAAVIQRQLT
jgi:ketosteroid isomerase-like protein